MRRDVAAAGALGRTIVAAAAWLAVASGGARAEDLTDPVPGHAGLTYAQMLKAAMPALAKGDGEAWAAGPIAHLRGMDGKASGLEALSFSSLDVLVVREGGRRRRLVLTDGNSSDEGFAAVLMVFDDEAARPKLLDMMDVGQDQMTGLSQPMAVGGGTDAFLVSNSHTDAGEGYDLTSPMYLRGGRLRVVTTLFTLNELRCGVERLQDIKVSGVAGAPYGAIRVRISDVEKRTDEDCDPRPKAHPHNRVYADDYRWSPAKRDFEPVTGVLERLSTASFKRASE